MNITISQIFWPKVSIWIIGKPYFFRNPKYTWEDKDISTNNIKTLTQYIWKQIIILNQYHSSEVVILDEKNKNQELAWDSIVTQLSDVAIFVLASDCVPIVLYDKESETIWVIHAGRKWLQWDIIQKTFDIFVTRFHSNLADIQVFIWPCISSEKYELWVEEIQVFRDKFSQFIKVSHDTFWKYYLDLRNIANTQILYTGIRKENIVISSECTYQNNIKYHSYRRNTHKSERAYGNNAFGIWYK